MWSALRPTNCNNSTMRCSNAARVLASLWMISASPMIARTVIRGFSEANGSWKMICMSRRSAPSALPSSPVTLRPSSHTSPELGSISRRIHRPVVDFPQPDSPTSPNVSPATISKLTSSTACTCSRAPASTPPRAGKFFTRLLTRSSGSLMARYLAQTTEYAGDFMVVFDGAQLWHRFCAGADGKRAARSEAAAGRRVQQARYRTGDRLEPALVPAGRGEPWDRANEALGIRVQRPGEELVNRSLLDNPARIHHRDPLGGLSDNPHRMGDQHDGHAKLLLHLG